MRDDDVKVEPLDMTSLSRSFSMEEINHAQDVFAVLFSNVATQAVKNIIFVAGSPSGAWRKLREWFEPQTIQAVNQLLKKYNNRALGTDEDPMELIGDIEAMQAKIRVLSPSQASNQEAVNVRIIAAVSSNPDYDIETRTMGYDGSISRENLVRTIASRYSQLQEAAAGRKAEAEAARKAGGATRALLAVNNGRKGGGKSKVECWACGELGHRRSECKAVCSTCGGKGHGTKKCRSVKKTGGDGQGEVKDAAESGVKKPEFACMSVTPQDASDHNIFGMDTTAGTLYHTGAY